MNGTRHRRHFPLGAGLAMMIWGTASAATITATVTDDEGRPLPDTVVMLTPEAGTSGPAPGKSRIDSATIDQTDETFVPAVVVIRTGGSVSFRNSDKTRHHLYSFSPVRRFEMAQGPGETSAPIAFDKPGGVAIGCNIHDHMTAHVYVTSAPWAMVTDAKGQAVLNDLPAGRFVATVWHPRLRPRAEPPAQTLTLATGRSTLTVTIPVLPPRRPRARDY